MCFFIVVTFILHITIQLKPIYILVAQWWRPKELWGCDSIPEGLHLY